MSVTIETLSNHDLSQQIDLFYPVSSERDYLARQIEQGTLKYQLRMYLHESLIKFLMEFVAGVKKTHIFYEQRQGRLYYPGIAEEMEASLQRAADLAGPASRETAELLGWQRTQALLENNAQVLQLSPPSLTDPNHGDYGFLFYFEHLGDQIVNHILRYDESRPSLTNSQRLRRELGLPLNLVQGFDANAYLLNPVANNLSSRQVKAGLTEFGLTFSDQTAVLFEQALRDDPRFQVLLMTYERAQLESKADNQARQALQEIYLIAQEKAALLGLLDRLPLPLIFYGGSCPASQFGMPTYGYASWLYGKEKKKILCCTCPKCYREVKAEIYAGKIHCPKCKAKADWQDNDQETFD